MRVLINCYSNTSPGTLVMTKDLLEALARVDKKSEYYIMIPPGYGYEALTLGKNFFLIPLKGKNPGYRFYRLYLDNFYIKILLRRYKPSVFLALGNMAPAKFNIPKIVLYHHPYYLWPEIYTFGGFTSKLYFKAEKFFFSKTVKKSDQFIVQNNFIKQSFLKSFNISEKKIHVITNALPHNMKDIPGSPEYSQATKDFIYPSAFVPHKNHYFLLAVARELKKLQKNDIRFLITLDPKQPEVVKYLNEITKEGLNTFIHNLGYLSHLELIMWYQRSYALFFPSLIETFGIPLIEAMAFKKPILSSNLPFTFQICGASAAAFFDPRNAKNATAEILRLIEDKDWRNKLIEEGTHRLALFPTWDQVAENYLMVLRSSLKENKKK